MSLLIRKTKKCCAKLLRKLQISNNHNHHNTGHSNNGQSQNNNQHHRDAAANNQQSSKNEKLAKNNNSAQKRTNNHRQSGNASAAVQMNNRRSRFNPHSDSFVYQHYDQHSTAGQHNTTAVPDVSASFFFDADDEYDQTINTTAFNGPASEYQPTVGVATKRHILTKRMPSNAPQLSETQLPHELRTSPAVKPRHMAAAASAASDTIIFTDNQIYVALEPLMPIDNVNDDSNAYADENNDLFDEQANLNNYHHNNNHNLSAVSKLTDKCPFHISSQLQAQQRRTAYANNQHNLSTLAQQQQQAHQQHAPAATAAPTAAIFEKVKFDPTKRYLQHTSPTNSSAGSSAMAPTDCYIPAASSYEAFLFDKCTQARTSSMYVDDQLLDSTFVQYWPFGREPVTVAAASAKLRQQQKQQMLQQQQQQRRWNEAYERDDGYVQQNAVLDNHRNRIRIDVEGGSPSLSGGSVRSCLSVGTTETWLDDEQFDNSLNEELQYRCDAIFAR